MSGWIPDIDAVAALERAIATIPKRSDVWERASERSDHIGAILADAALQPGVDYRAVVEPRVKRIRAEHPSAATVSGLLKLLETIPAPVLLGNRNARKCGAFRDLVRLLNSEGVDSALELRAWLQHVDSRSKLLQIKGVGPKTCAYLKLLVGLPAIAVDIHLRRLALDAGVDRPDDDLERLFALAAEHLGIPLAVLDGSLWQDGSDGGLRARQSERGRA